MRNGLHTLAAAWLTLAAASARAEGEIPLHLERRPGALPALEWGKPIECDARYRYQCDDATKTCLVAPNVELGGDGKPTTLELSRVNGCSEGSLHLRALGGYQLVEAVADSPPGWVRDERGRVMQFNFDMHRRIWLGGGFSPDAPGGTWRSSGEAEFGTRIDFGDDDNDSLARLHLLEGRLDPGQGRYELTAMSLDWSRSYENAPIRITTFVGGPKRHDLYLNVGLDLLAGHVEAFTRPRNQTWTTIGAVQPTLDLWRSHDMDSYLRLRVGPGLDYDSVSTVYFLDGIAGLDFEGILDADGFHRLYANADAMRLWGKSDEAALNRVEARAGYELILLAVNDQPISAVLEGRASWRDDLAGVPAGWDYGGYAGLRFSFWAPARRGAARVHEAR